MKKPEILKNQLIQKAQQYFTNIASIFEVHDFGHFWVHIPEIGSRL